MKKTENTYRLSALTLIFFILWAYSKGFPADQNYLFIEDYFDIEWLKSMLSHIEFSYAGRIISVANLGYVPFIKFILIKFYDFLMFLLLAFLWYRVFEKRLRSEGKTALLSFVVSMGFAALLALYPGWKSGSQMPFMAEDFILKSYGALTGVILAGWYRRK